MSQLKIDIISIKNNNETHSTMYNIRSTEHGLNISYCTLHSSIQSVLFTMPDKCCQRGIRYLLKGQSVLVLIMDEL